MPSLTIIDSEYTGTNKFKEYPFELSNFQKNAIDSYLKGDNVFIAAPTGSGKTLPAEFTINHAVIQRRLKRYLIKNLRNLLKNFPMQM